LGQIKNVIGVYLYMQFIQGKNRTQSILFPESLDQIIDQDNEVRIIDLFVESINLSDFKFVIKSSLEGRPASNKHLCKSSHLQNNKPKF